MEKIWATGILLISTSLFALLTPLFKKIHSDIPAFLIMAITMCILFLCSIFAHIFFEKNFDFQALHTNQWLLLISIGIINFFGFWFWLIAMKHLPAIEVEMFVILSPIFVGIFAFFLLKEPIHAKHFLGLFIMAMGLFVALR